MTPEEKVAKKKALERAKERQRKEIVDLKKSLDVVLRTEEGRKVMRYIAQICGHNESDVVVNPQTGEVSERSTVHNATRKAVYLLLRSHATPELLIPIEFVKPEDDIFEDETK